MYLLNNITFFTLLPTKILPKGTLSSIEVSNEWVAIHPGILNNTIFHLTIIRQEKIILKNTFNFDSKNFLEISDVEDFDAQ